MAKGVPMKKIWEARSLVLHGYTVAEIASRLKVSESVVYRYTKAERAKVKARG